MHKLTNYSQFYFLAKWKKGQLKVRVAKVPPKHYPPVVKDEERVFHRHADKANTDIPNIDRLLLEIHFLLLEIYFTTSDIKAHPYGYFYTVVTSRVYLPDDVEEHSPVAYAYLLGNLKARSKKDIKMVFRKALC